MVDNVSFQLDPQVTERRDRQEMKVNCLPYTLPDSNAMALSFHSLWRRYVASGTKITTSPDDFRVFFQHAIEDDGCDDAGIENFALHLMVTLSSRGIWRRQKQSLQEHDVTCFKSWATFGESMLEL